ncbi:MAG TPA: MFS transporter [Gaiellaceae bacterium]|nr:MFS transporter [Gaiellaceae bacterium]
MRRLLSDRDARLLLSGQTLSAFGDWAMLIVLAVWMKSLTGSSALAGLTFFVFGAGALAAPLGGLLADRVRRRPLMIVSDCVLGVVVLVLLLVHDRGDAWLIYAVALVYGAVGTVFFPARAALLKVMLPEELLADANGALSSTREGLRIVAPLAGAGLYTLFGGGSVAVLDSVTFAASAFFLSRMRVPEQKPAPPEHHFTREVTAGIRHIWATLPLRQVVLGISIALLVVGFAETLIFSVIAALGEKPSFFGVFATIQGTGSIAGGLTAAPLVRRLGEVRVVGLGLALFAVADVCLIAPSLGVVLVAGPIAGVGVAWAIVGYSTALQTRTPLAIQGRVSAAADLTLGVAQTTSIGTGALLATIVDYRILFAVMAAVVLASAGYLVTRRGAPAPAVEPTAA